MSGGPQRILIVEDDPAIGDVLTALFETSGFITLLTDTWRQSLAAARQQRPDGCVVDLGLPDGDGIELIRQLRCWSPVPIVVLTARSQESARLAAFAAGADDYVLKPFSGLELIARVRAVLRRAVYHRAPQMLLRLGDTVINLQDRSVVRPGGELLKLTPMEHRILECLVRQQDSIVTHEQILRQVWRSQHEVDLRSLRVYVASLRRKLETDPTQPQHILTEVGVGYRLAADRS